MLRALLEGQHLNRSTRRDAASVLQFPWCWPPEGHDLLPLARQVLPAGSRAPRRGEALLVAFREGQGGLYALGEGPIPLVKDALRAWDVANVVISRDFAGWRLPVGSSPPRPLAQLIAPADFARASELDGGSFGAAIFLAGVSRALGQTIPTDTVVLAGLELNGRLVPVGELSAKLTAVRHWAPAVRQCIVAKGQETVATASGLAVTGLETAHELVDSVFQGWEAGDPEEQARRLLVATVGQARALLTWERVEAAALALASNPAASKGARWRARVAAAIAARHEGRPGSEFPFDDAPPDLPRPLRDRLAAHQVQHLVDGGGEDGGYLERMRTSLPSPRDASTTELEVWGAVARGFARRREYERAAEQLSELVGAWLDLGSAPDASRALTEWARVLGIRQDAATLRTRVEPIATRLSSELRATGHHPELGFVALAMGRAWVQARQPAVAEAWWEAADWSLVHGWVSAAVARWRARMRWDRGDREHALTDLAHVAGPPDMAALARLDADVLQGRPVDESLAAFLSTAGQFETAWLLAGADTDVERARRLFAESPY